MRVLQALLHFKFIILHFTLKKIIKLQQVQLAFLSC